MNFSSFLHKNNMERAILKHIYIYIYIYIYTNYDYEEMMKINI